ncbi:outer membrane beta-barrel protein [Hymenobacter jeollabukensis]|uniref:Outer membrane protein beta-barrel domain-containing protein n=1 Tax=Hymenobacter jeollabukensis TaxID=2025313 RepID=A0A5R8WTT6_9BACT|nr:outer membrane beta-barrel protein [Hymenobacter jeollabukensis]TLM95180.1 hypothetical protein FDY95_05155 [Hymenobacter jeollabukensis]
MKRFLLAVTLFGAAILSSQAQTAPGTILLSGNVGYASSKSEVTSTGTPATVPNSTSTSQQFHFAPQAGVFLADRLAVGVLASLDQTKATQPDYYYGPGGQRTTTRTTREKLLLVGPFARYYQMVGDKAGFYGQLSGGFASSKAESTLDDVSASKLAIKSRGGFADLQPGFVFFPSDKLGLELALGSLRYFTLKDQKQDTQPAGNQLLSKTTSFEARFGLTQLTLGASFYLGGKGSN